MKLAACALAVAALAGTAPAGSASARAAQSDPLEARRALEAQVERWRDSLELDLAAEILREAEAERPTEVRLVAMLALAHHAAGDDERALELLGEAKQPALALARARIALDQDELERARALLAPQEGAAEPVRFPTELECWLLLGRAQARAGDCARAEPLLAEFVRRAPWSGETPGALHALAACARARGDAAEAERLAARQAELGAWHAFHRARRIQAREHPKDPLPRLGLAQLWLAAGDPTRAKRFLDEALALDARFCRALALYAEVELQSGRAAESRARAEAAVACDAKLADAHLALARALKALGDEAGASKAHSRYRDLGGREPL